MKRLTYLLIIIAVIIVIVLVGYFLRYRAGTSNVPQGTGSLPSVSFNKQPPVPQTNEQPPAPAQTQIGEQKFGVLTQNQAVDYFIDEQNNAVVIQPDGKIVKIINGEVSALSSSPISELRSAEFSYDGKKILIVFGGKNFEQSIFNVESKSWSPLPSGLESPTWSPVNYQVAYLKPLAGGAASLETLDISKKGARPQQFLRLHNSGLSLFWLSPNQMILGEKGSSFSKGSVWSFDLKTKSLSQFIAGELGLDYAWNKKTLLGLVFKTDLSRRGGFLSLYDNLGNLLQNMAFLTLPSKCGLELSGATTTNKTALKIMYCAIPKDTQVLNTSYLPDEYQKKLFYTDDQFFKINLSSGAIDEVSGAPLNFPVDAEDLKVFNQNLFFINRLDQKLYAISLK